MPNGLAGGIPLTFAQIAWPNFNPSNFPVVTVPGTPGTAPGVWIDRNAGYPSKSYQWSFGVQREIVRNLVVDVAYVGNRGVWLPSTGAVNYNANTPQSLLAAGTRYHHRGSARAILTAPIGSAAAGPFQNKLPYAGFPLTATVAQSLRPYPQFTTAPTPLWAPLGDNWYNSLQLKVIKRLSHGLDVSYNFTWSKTLTNGIEATRERYFQSEYKQVPFELRPAAGQQYQHHLHGARGSVGQQQDPEVRAERLANGSPSHLRQRDADPGSCLDK